MQCFQFQINNGALSSLIPTIDNLNPSPFAGHTQTQSEISSGYNHCCFICFAIRFNYNLILFFERETQTWWRSYNPVRNYKLKKKIKNIFQLTSYFASHKETLLTMFATEGLGLHHILMFLSFQSAQAGYCNLTRPRERWYDIQLNLFSEEAERYMKHDVSLTDSSWRHSDLA